MYSPGDKKDRQYGTLDQIRPDHVRRYMWAATVLPPGATVLDLACGCGYGSWLLHSVGLGVTSIDASEEAIQYAQEHYPGPKYIRQRAEDTKDKFDAFVTFETLEHLPDPAGLLRNVKADILIASVPNEKRYPFKKETFEGESFPHLRHYTPDEFESLLAEGGYKLAKMFSQEDKLGYISEGRDGMFLIGIAGAISLP